MRFRAEKSHLYGWLTNLTFTGQLGLPSAFGGMVFWLIAASGAGRWMAAGCLKIKKLL
jgi:hypothetical protein